MIGGDAFKVEKISSAMNRAGDILVGGITENYNDAGDLFKTSFLYLLKTSDCTISWSHEFPSMNDNQQPHVTWSHDESFAYMLAYGTANSGSEYLVVMKDPHLKNTWTTPNEGNPDIYRLRTNVGSLYSL